MMKQIGTGKQRESLANPSPTDSNLFHRVSHFWNPSGTPDAFGRPRMAERGAKKFTARWIETISVETRTDFTDPDVFPTIWPVH